MVQTSDRESKMLRGHKSDGEIIERLLTVYMRKISESEVVNKLKSQQSDLFRIDNEAI